MAAKQWVVFPIEVVELTESDIPGASLVEPLESHGLPSTFSQFKHLQPN